MTPLDEVGAEETLLHLDLEPMCFGIVEELVRKNRVGVLQGVVVIGKTCAGGDSHDTIDHLARLAGGDASMRHEEVGCAPLELHRSVGRQLEVAGTWTSTTGTPSSELNSLRAVSRLRFPI